MAPWVLRPAAAAAAGRAIRRSYHADGAPPRKLRGPRFSPLNRHNHEVDALLEEVKNTPVSMISDDLTIRTMRQYFYSGSSADSGSKCSAIIVVAAAVILGYCWGYNRVAQSSTVGSEPPKEHEGK